MPRKTVRLILLFGCIAFIGQALYAAIPTPNKNVNNKKTAQTLVPVRLDNEQFSISATNVFPGTDIIILARSGERPLRTIDGRLVIKKQVFEYPAFQDETGAFKIIIPIPPRMPSGNYRIEIDKLYDGSPSETVTFSIIVNDAPL